MSEDGLCIGCGRDCLDSIECRCGREELCACEECRDSGIPLLCGDCRDRAERVVAAGSYPCRDFMDDEAGTEREAAGRLSASSPVGP